MMREYPEKGLTPEKINMIVLASPLHDIGKNAIKDTILLKPGKLTEKEFEYMKSHTICGCEILENLENAWSKEYGKVSMDICRHHHERYDGNGYPDGNDHERRKRRFFAGAVALSDKLPGRNGGIVNFCQFTATAVESDKN